MPSIEEEQVLEVAGLTVQVVRKGIKNLHVAVYPPDGRVRVAAPLSVSVDAIRGAVLTRLPWIKRQQRAFAGQARQTRREFVSGETHYLYGRALRLQVRPGRAQHRIEVAPDRILLDAPADSTPEARARFMEGWYRRSLRREAAPRIARWSAVLGLVEPSWGIRRMKTKWGSCNPDRRAIWINIELAKKPLPALDYVIVHELAHLKEPNHSESFVAILDETLPGWRGTRRDLNLLPLAFEPSFEG